MPHFRLSHKNYLQMLSDPKLQNVRGDAAMVSYYKTMTPPEFLDCMYKAVFLAMPGNIYYVEGAEDAQTNQA